MNQIKIGSFIQEKRKEKNLTQLQLAQKLNVTDRAVSKWETGRAMPDSAIMLDLCRILGITVTDLLNGEVISMDNYNEKIEQTLLEMTKQKEEADKRLLAMEIFVGVLSLIIFFSLTIVASYVQIEEWLRITLILIGFIPLLIATPFMLKIEQVAGYYKCGNCGHRYVPEYKSVFYAPHMGRTRYLKCPECGKKTWSKKVISKEDK